MKTQDICRVEVEWMEQFGNNPQLQFVLKRDRVLTPSSEFRWNQNGNLFYAVKDGEVRYLYHNRNDHNGFGFAKFELHMADDWDASQWKDCARHERDFGSRTNRDVCCVLNGRVLTLTGPWSSGASAVSAQIGPIVSTSTLEGPSRVTVCNPNWYHRQKRKGRAYQGTAFATNHTLEFVQSAIDVHAPHLEMYEGDYGWYPVRKGDPPKNPRKGRTRVFDPSLSDEQSMAVEC
jgi:hypothetical protein